MNSPDLSVTPNAGLSGGTAVTDLKSNHLSFLETIGQSIANVSPTFMPALAVVVVAGIAGPASWLVYVLATLSLLLVGLNLSRLASRYPSAGSFFVYISRSLGPLTGGLVGWGLILAYLCTAMAVVVGVAIFMAGLLEPYGLSVPPLLIYVVTVGLAWLLAYQDIRMSSRIGLLLEGVSIAIILVLAALVIGRHEGSLFDARQLTLQGASLGSVAQAAVFAIFSFVGFESAASLGRESRNPTRNIPRAVIISTLLAGSFFVIMAYVMVLGFGGDAARLAKDPAPLDTLGASVGVAGLGTLIYIGAVISAFACALASINAAARLLFSMGRYQFVHVSMGMVHARHHTPHVAVSVGAALTLLVPVLMLGMDIMTAFGLLGTIATFGFVLGYFLISVATPLYLHRTGDLRPRDILTGVLGALAMLGAFVGSVYPAPAAPYDKLPYVFLAYLGIGLIWLLALRTRAPQILASIENDLETSETAVIGGRK